MGNNDAAEQLEVARAECVRLELELSTGQSAARTVRAIHAREMFGDCVEDGQPFPCRTIRTLDIAEEARLRIVTEPQPGGNQ